MKKLLIVTVVLALLISCGDGSDGDGDSNGGLTILKTAKFWAQRADNNSFYQLDANLLAEDAMCEIWAEKGSGVTSIQAQSIANTYSGNIYPKMINAFSKPITDETGKLMYSTTLEFAHWFVTGESNGGKLTILLLDIKDGYVRGSNDAFIAGYFWPYDIYSTVPPDYQTNERVMLYIDINPLDTGSELFYGTIAHEMQHLMNFVTSFLTRIKGNTVSLMDIWIDEGLSSAAEWIYLGKHLENRINNLKNDPTGLIAKGNNFFVWGNREDENKNAVLDDYATVYLFFQWLRLQTRDTIYKEIIASEESDYKAIINAVIADNASDWPELLGAWLKANHDKSSSGVFGYKGDTILNSIKWHYAPGGLTSINLYPGEGVYSYANLFNTSSLSSSGNIKYVSLGTVSAPTTLTGALLTYNASTTVDYKDGKLTTTPESGTITGAAPANITTGRSALNGVPFGPFPISAGDMLRRRGHEGNFPETNNLRLLTEAVIE